MRHNSADVDDCFMKDGFHTNGQYATGHIMFANLDLI